MTTTPEPTAEQIIAQAALDADTVLPDALDPEEQAADIAKLAGERLRAAGLLVGAPADGQIQRVRETVFAQSQRERGREVAGSGVYYPSIEAAREIAGAAGVAPQDECGHRHPFRDAVCGLPSGHESGHMCEKPAPQEPSVEYLEVGHPSGERQPAYVEPVPSPDREKLIEAAIAASDRVNHEELCSCEKPPEACEMYSHRPWSHDPELVANEVLRLAALAAQPVLDEGKVTEVIWKRAIQKTSMGFSIFNRDGAHEIARALCEAAKRGELS